MHVPTPGFLGYPGNEKLRPSPLMRTVVFLLSSQVPDKSNEQGKEGISSELSKPDQFIMVYKCCEPDDQPKK